IVGDIHSNDNIEVHGHFADEYGHIATSSGGDGSNDLDETDGYSDSNKSTITIPPVDYGMLENEAIINFTTYGDVTLDNNSPTWEKTGIQFIDGDLRVKNGGVVIVNEGAIVVTGSVIFDNGSELTITKSDYPITPLGLVAKGDIILKAKTTFIAGVVQSYDPLDDYDDSTYTSGKVELHNDAVIWGSVIAETIFLHNGTEINYEKGNTQKYVTQGDPFYKKISWREL
ncbi:unnamed protein product, partial [marine sediment metagenome]